MCLIFDKPKSNSLTRNQKNRKAVGLEKSIEFHLKYYEIPQLSPCQHTIFADLLAMRLAMELM